MPEEKEIRYTSSALKILDEFLSNLSRHIKDTALKNAQMDEKQMITNCDMRVAITNEILKYSSRC